MTLPPDRIAALAEQLLAARDANRQIAPISAREPDFDWPDAHAIAGRIRTLRFASGEVPVGRKIGFTNRTLWERYGVTGPIWGDMFDRSVHRLDTPRATVPLPPLPELRIEPEIAFGLGTAPEPGMDVASLARCIAWVAHGFELVSSVFPGWRFTGLDSHAAFGLHGALYLGPAHKPEGFGSDLPAALSGLTLSLSGGAGVEAQGKGTDVLDGPVQALGFLVEGIAAAPGEAPLRAGDIVTTGTLTDAMPVAKGDTWRTVLTGGPLPGLELTFS